MNKSSPISKSVKPFMLDGSSKMMVASRDNGLPCHSLSACDDDEKSFVIKTSQGVTLFAGKL